MYRQYIVHLKSILEKVVKRDPKSSSLRKRRALALFLFNKALTAPSLYPLPLLRKKTDQSINRRTE
jgi:hypothetical protein